MVIHFILKYLRIHINDQDMAIFRVFGITIEVFLQAPIYINNLNHFESAVAD